MMAPMSTETTYSIEISPQGWVFDCPPEEEAELSPLVVDTMQTVLVSEVPIVAEVGSGTNWLEAH